ncbi:MAG: MerR family DNA-binding transcriptional regulator [Geminicoccaceae bacterium]
MMRAPRQRSQGESDPTRHQSAIQIGELASALGVTPKTLRHYEKIGLIPEAERTGSGYRMFSAAAAKRAGIVVGLRSLDLSIDAIRQVLETNDGRSLRQRVLGLLDREVQDYALKIAVLQGRHDDLEARYHALLATPQMTDGDCVCAALMRPCTCERST